MLGPQAEVKKAEFQVQSYVTGAIEVAFTETRKIERQEEHFWVVVVLRVSHEFNFRYNKFEMPFIAFNKNT